MGKLIDELSKKQKALEESIQWLEDEGDRRKSSRNSVQSSNEVEWEIGGFGKGAKTKEKTPNEILDGIWIRTRQSSLEAALNSGEALDAISDMEQQHKLVMKEIMHIKIAIGFVLAAVIYSFLL